MLRFGEREIAKDKLYAAKKSLKISNVHVDNIVISKLVKIKTNSKYLIGYADKAVRPLVWIKPNVLMSFRIHDEKLLEKYKVTWTKIQDLKKY